ncbi:RDD family protein [uncultured Aquimarina sp.]|uniref:RDD family protein n=1 Tax=uncultured Aquimarina sp. TaxID=575652 RepID=UPI00261F7642|nr:RDD family protein [uncultured Aquimarina sp.]
MENEFQDVMSQRTDEELIKILTVDIGKYNPTAIEAAEIEIKTRTIDSSRFEEIKEKAATEKIAKENVNSNIVSSGIRFLNLLIDSIICYILIIIAFYFFGFVIAPIITTTNSFIIIMINLIIIFGTFFAYHSIMEIKFQKTIGKFITKTKVVKLDGKKPDNSDIIARTFYRLIPFDRISFLFTKNGIHDYLSKTSVIKDATE